jgi:hypothetical protein
MWFSNGSGAAIWKRGLTCIAHEATDCGRLRPISFACRQNTHDVLCIPLARQGVAKRRFFCRCVYQSHRAKTERGPSGLAHEMHAHFHEKAPKSSIKYGIPCSHNAAWHGEVPRFVPCEQWGSHATQSWQTLLTPDRAAAHASAASNKLWARSLEIAPRRRSHLPVRCMTKWPTSSISASGRRRIT